MSMLAAAATLRASGLALTRPPAARTGLGRRSGLLAVVGGAARSRNSGRGLARCGLRGRALGLLSAGSSGDSLAAPRPSFSAICLGSSPFLASTSTRWPRATSSPAA